MVENLEEMKVEVEDWIGSGSACPHRKSGERSSRLEIKEKETREEKRNKRRKGDLGITSKFEIQFDRSNRRRKDGSEEPKHPSTLTILIIYNKNCYLTHIAILERIPVLNPFLNLKINN